MVQVHHDEGVANRIDPESCADAREGISEALIGERIGQPLSRESTLFSGADVVPLTEGIGTCWPAIQRLCPPIGAVPSRVASGWPNAPHSRRKPRPLGSTTKVFSIFWVTAPLAFT